MIIFFDTTQNFNNHIRNNTLTGLMADTFYSRFGRHANHGEINSWQNSLPRIRDLIELADLKDNMIALEYEVPYNQNRIDCLLFGKDNEKNSNIVLIELKQWNFVNSLEDEGNFEEVETFVGGSHRIIPHPSQQAKGYHNYLKNFIAEFENNPPLTLFSCAYCHNYIKAVEQGLFNPIYKKILDDFPVYTRDDVKELALKIKYLLNNGNGFEIFNRFMRSPLRPSQKLLDNVSKIVQNEEVFSLLNEQLVAKNLIWSKVRKAEKQKTKSVIIVHGGPGTGKSVIAINILAEAALRNKTVFYGCKSKPFVNGLKKMVGNDGALLFSNLYRFLPSRVEENQIDLLLIDEAHRIEKSSNFRYTRPEDNTDMPQIDQLIRCAKTSVFFIDDKQNVRFQEIGSSELIRESARKFGAALSETTLFTQYRCMGSNDYLIWIESLLGYREEKKVFHKNDIFDFRIMDSPFSLYEAIKAHEKIKSNSARLTAGFCWPWSDPNPDGTLVKDVVIGDFAMSWEAKEGRYVQAGTPRWFEWAYKTGGVEQIGCIYTAQGFEFDYVGVIIGNDLYYDEKTDSLKTNIKATADPTLKRSSDTFDSHIRNIYRTLLTRGMKGCYVYFVNKETEKYFRRFIE